MLLTAALGGGGDGDDAGGDVRVALEPQSAGEIAAEGNSNQRSRVTILEIADNARSDNQFERPAQGKKYWAVRVRVENAGTEEVGSLDWLLRDSTNAESTQVFVSGVGPGLDPFYTLTPGGRQEGWLVFEIAADAQPVWLRADPNPFLANDLYFDAP